MAPSPPRRALAIFDGDYAGNTVVLFDGDPLQAAMVATQRNLIHDPYIMRRLPRLIAAAGFEAQATRATRTMRISIAVALALAAGAQGVAVESEHPAHVFGKGGAGVYRPPPPPSATGNAPPRLGKDGAGVLKGSMFGKLLGERAVGADSSYLSDALSLAPPNWLPPEPFRRVGVVSAIKYQAAVAGAER